MNAAFVCSAFIACSISIYSVSGDPQRINYIYNTAESQPGFIQQNQRQSGFVQQTGLQPGFIQQTQSQPGFIQQTQVQPGYVQQTGSRPGFVQQTERRVSWTQNGNGPRIYNVRTNTREIPLGNGGISDFGSGGQEGGAQVYTYTIPDGNNQQGNPVLLQPNGNNKGTVDGLPSVLFDTNSNENGRPGSTTYWTRPITTQQSGPPVIIRKNPNTEPVIITKPWNSFESNNPSINDDNTGRRPTNNVIYTQPTVLYQPNGNNGGSNVQIIPSEDSFNSKYPLINDDSGRRRDNGRKIDELPETFWSSPKPKRPKTSDDSDFKNANGLTEADMPPPGQCGTTVRDRIYGGKQTSIGEFPWYALIMYTISRARCGGSLINKDYVITAAHCIRNPELKAYKAEVAFVRLGEYNLRKGRDCDECDLPENIRIQETFVHENYGNKKNDIALLRLSRPAKVTEYIRPICLPFAQQHRSFDQVPLVVTGFGKTEIESKQGLQLSVQVNGFNFDECKRTWDVDSTQICAGGEKDKDSCNGDSGGPLMGFGGTRQKNYTFLVGIVSYGSEDCGQEGVPGVYTRVDQFLGWILQHMQH